MKTPIILADNCDGQPPLPPATCSAPKPWPKSPELIITQDDINLCLGSGELLPCPFCGHWAMSAGELTPNGKATCWKISCTGSKGLMPSCCASVWATDPDQNKARHDAVSRWNRRVPNACMSESPTNDVNREGGTKRANGDSLHAEVMPRQQH